MGGHADLSQGPDQSFDSADEAALGGGHEEKGGIAEEERKPGDDVQSRVKAFKGDDHEGIFKRGDGRSAGEKEMKEKQQAEKKP
jgi:hypothetical protein